MKYASLVILSFHRQEYLARCMQTLHANTRDYPYELFVVDDGSRDACWPFLYSQLKERRLSRLILNAGDNLGVGEGIFDAFAIAKGDFLGKIDADLEFESGWLSSGVAVLEQREDIGMVGFFNYRAYSPNDKRFNVLNKESVGDHQIGIVDDFVSSVFLIRRETYEKYGPMDRGSDAFAEDVMFKQKLQKGGLKLAITIPDLVRNTGFGLGKSEVVKAGEDGKPVVSKISHQPLLFAR